VRRFLRRLLAQLFIAAGDDVALAALGDDSLE